MKAAQFHPETHKVSVEEIPVPSVKDDEILIKTIAASICHSDMVWLIFHLSCSTFTMLAPIKIL